MEQESIGGQTPTVCLSTHGLSSAQKTTRTGVKVFWVVVSLICLLLVGVLFYYLHMQSPGRTFDPQLSTGGVVPTGLPALLLGHRLIIPIGILANEHGELTSGRRLFPDIVLANSNLVRKSMKKILSQLVHNSRDPSVKDASGNTATAAEAITPVAGTQTPSPDLEVTFNGNGEGRICYDGILVSTSQIPNYKEQYVNDTITIPPDTEVIGIHYRNGDRLDGGDYGVIAYLSNGIITDSSWKCKAQLLGDPAAWCVAGAAVDWDPPNRTNSDRSIPGAIEISIQDADQVTCVRTIRCPFITMIKDGALEDRVPTVGTSVSVICDIGFAATGDGRAHCGVDATWGSIASCILEEPNENARLMQRRDVLELVLAGADLDIVKELGHQMTTNLAKCQNQWMQVIECGKLITKEEWNSELGNTITLGSDALAAQSLSSLKLEVAVEQEEYEPSQSDISIRLFVNSKNQYAILGHGEYKIPPGFRVSLLIRKISRLLIGCIVGHISRTKCRHDTSTMTYYPGAYSSPVCLKDVDQHHIIKVCHCCYKVPNNDTIRGACPRLCAGEDVSCVSDVLNMLSSSGDQTYCLMRCEQDEWTVTMTFLTNSRKSNSSRAMATITFDTIASLVYIEQVPTPTIAEIGGLLGIHSGTSFISIVEMVVLFICVVMGFMKTR